MMDRRGDTRNSACVDRTPRPASLLGRWHPRSSGNHTVSNADIQPASATRQPSYFPLLFASLICVGIGQTLIFAVLPPAARSLGLTEVQVGSIFTVSAVLWMLMSPFWGRRSDVVGRRPLILLGLGGYAASMIAFAIGLHISLAGRLSLLAAFVTLMAARSLFGLFGSAAMPAAQAYVADHTAPHQRAGRLAQLGAAFALGTIVGPVVVAVLLEFGLVAPFYAAGLLGALSVAAIALWLPHTRPVCRQQAAVRRLSPLDRRALPFLLVAVGQELTQSIALLAAGFYAMDVLAMAAAESAQAVGVMLMGEAAAMLVTQLVVIRLLQPSPRTMIAAGAALAAASFAAIVASRSYLPMFAAMTLLGVAFGLLRPGMMAGASLAVGVDEQGGVAGLMNATGGLAVTIAPFVGMSLYQFLPQAPYLLSLGLALAMLAAVFAHPRLRAADGRSEAQTTAS